LERRLGAALFVKSPLGYALTDLGERMRDKATVAEQHLNGVVDVGQGASRGLTGQIRIGAPDGAANYLLPQVCAAIQADNPDLEVQILALPRVVNLSRREADMAIAVSPPAAGRLSVQRIADYQLHLAMRRGAPAIKGLADLKSRRIVGYISDMIFDKELDYLREAGVDTVQMASNSVAVQLQILRHAGVGVVHDFALPFAPELQQVIPDVFALKRAFYLVRHASDRNSDRLSRFAAALCRGMRDEVVRLEAAAGLTVAPDI
jgi:DNA-binding transcriptional LysR family regulator